MTHPEGRSEQRVEPARGYPLLNRRLGEPGASQLIARDDSVLLLRDARDRTPNLPFPVPSARHTGIRNNSLLLSPVLLNDRGKTAVRAGCCRACASAGRPAWSAACAGRGSAWGGSGGAR